MLAATSQYFLALSSSFGRGWSRFWFTKQDPATLCVLRLLCGLIALYTVATYSFDLVRFFGPDGMIPVETVEKWINASGSDRFVASYLQGIDDGDPLTPRELQPEVLWALHGAGLVVLVLYTVGFFTRLTSVLAAVVVLSYFHRGPMLTSEFEPVLTMVMVYICLGPAGAWCSVDSLIRRRRKPAVASADPSHGSLATSWSANLAVRLIQLHVVVIYAMMGVAKLGGTDVWWMGDAVWWLAAKPESRLIDLTWMHNYDLLINAWTHAIVAFELGFAVLIWNRLARPLLLAIAVPMWVGMALLTGYVPFCAMMLVASASFLPASFWRNVAACCGVGGSATAGESVAKTATSS